MTDYTENSYAQQALKNRVQLEADGFKVSPDGRIDEHEHKMTILDA